MRSAETLRPLLASLGAVPEQLADFDHSIRSWARARRGSLSRPAARTCCASAHDSVMSLVPRSACRTLETPVDVRRVHLPLWNVKHKYESPNSDAVSLEL
jgi:hypothetical protein